MSLYALFISLLVVIPAVRGEVEDCTREKLNQCEIGLSEDFGEFGGIFPEKEYLDEHCGPFLNRTKCKIDFNDRCPDSEADHQAAVNRPVFDLVTSVCDDSSEINQGYLQNVGCYSDNEAEVLMCGMTITAKVEDFAKSMKNNTDFSAKRELIPCIRMLSAMECLIDFEDKCPNSAVSDEISVNKTMVELVTLACVNRSEIRKGIATECAMTQTKFQHCGTFDVIWEFRKLTALPGEEFLEANCRNFQQSLACGLDVIRNCPNNSRANSGANAVRPLLDMVNGICDEGLARQKYLKNVDCCNSILKQGSSCINDMHRLVRMFQMNEFQNNPISRDDREIQHRVFPYCLADYLVLNCYVRKTSIACGMEAASLISNVLELHQRIQRGSECPQEKLRIYADEFLMYLLRNGEDIRDAAEMFSEGFLD